MRKLIALFLVIGVTVWALGPALALGIDGTASTGLTRGTGGGQAPIVKVKWEMDDWDGTDSSTDPGAQLPPPGVWDGKLIYKVCAIVTDPNGVGDLDLGGVYADIYYPDDKAYSEDPSDLDEHKGEVPYPSPGIGACGAHIEQNKLVKKDKAFGYDLFCNKIRINNTNLPTFFTGYDYDEICGVGELMGELMKEEAFVYCDIKTLKWEDPAGFYTVKVTAQDKTGNDSNVLENDFEYLPLTAFQKDFTNVNYGEVMLSTDKKISGDLNFGTADKPTIRNTGNTRLYMKVAQDDMGLGYTNGLGWNVEFDARVGSHVNDWTDYNPYDYKSTPPPDYPADYTQLEDILELSEVEEMDFSIHVKKWPNENTGYTGTMWLTTNPALFRTCNGG